MATSIKSLQTAGGQHILISNQYPLPSFDMRTTTLAVSFFNAFKSDLQAGGVKYILADTYSLISQVEADPLKYGITASITSNACAAAAGFAGVGITTGYGVTCAPTTTPSGSLFGYGNLISADALSTHLFMDGVHLTEAGEIITADYIDGLLAVPVPAALPLFASGLGALGLLGWRRKRRAANTAASLA